MPTLIDPEHIYPRRMGILKGALVVQYYNLDRDCFKKHVIPYDNTQNPQKIVENILKNPKHSVFLRKVAPHHIKAVISGKRIDVFNNNQRSLQNQRSNSISEYSLQENNRNGQISNNQTSNYDSRTNSYSKSYDKSRIDSSSHVQSSFPSRQSTQKWNSSKIKQKQYDESGSFDISKSKISKKQKNKSEESVFEDSHGYSMNFDQQSMNISVVPIKQTNKKNEHIVQEQIDYEEDFQQFQQIQQPKKIQVIAKDNQPQKSKQQTKKKKQKKKQPEEFQFLDLEEQGKKKKKKKKKQKSGKNKSKQSSQQPSKEASIRDQIPIQEQFDFL